MSHHLLWQAHLEADTDLREESEKVTPNNKLSREGDPPTTQTKTVCTNSLRKFFPPCFLFIFKGNGGDNLHKLSRNCLRKLCFYLGGRFLGVGLPFIKSLPHSRKESSGSPLFSRVWLSRSSKFSRILWKMNLLKRLSFSRISLNSLESLENGPSEKKTKLL